MSSPSKISSHSPYTYSFDGSISSSVGAKRSREVAGLFSSNSSSEQPLRKKACRKEVGKEANLATGLLLQKGREEKRLSFFNDRETDLTHLRKFHLFVNGEEVVNCYKMLKSFSMNRDFRNLYDTFLVNIQRDDWYKEYTRKAMELAKLAFIAFLENEISQEALFVALAVSTVFRDFQWKFISRYTVCVLTEEILFNYLEDCNYLASLSPKESDDRFLSISSVVGNFDERTPLERTSIEFFLPEGGVKAELASLSHEQKMGLRECSKTGSVARVLLPPYFTLNLLGLVKKKDLIQDCVLSLSDAKKEEFFGEYRKKISIANPFTTKAYAFGGVASSVQLCMQFDGIVFSFSNKISLFYYKCLGDCIIEKLSSNESEISSLNRGFIDVFQAAVIRFKRHRSSDLAFKTVIKNCLLDFYAGDEEEDFKYSEWIKSTLFPILRNLKGLGKCSWEQACQDSNREEQLLVPLYTEEELDELFLVIS